MTLSASPDERPQTDERRETPESDVTRARPIVPSSPPPRTAVPGAGRTAVAQTWAERVTGWWRRGRAQLRQWNQKLGVQPPGWILLGLIIVCAVLGGVLGWVELRVVAVAGAVALLAAIGFTLGRQTYAVTLNLHARQVIVGERALGDLAVENTSSRRLLPARIELPVGRRLASFTLPSLGGKASHEEVFAVPTSRRSVIRVGPARTVRGDPFGLMGREILWTEAIDLYVHPRTVRLPGRDGGFIRDLEGHSTAKLTNSDISFHALREYSPGDDRRHVHWRSSARTGTLMVRQFEETRRSQIAIGLDLGANSYDTGDEFELAVSVVGSLSLQALRDENNVTVLTSAGRLKALSPKRALDELCTVEVGRGGLQALTSQVRHTDPGASVVSVVTGSNYDQRALRLACAMFDVDVQVLAIRIEWGAEFTVQTTNNLHVITLGDLADLPRAIRRSSL
ncbi:MAG: DUF58 domain-containing protein [Propionibacteriaceae bacterium]